MSRVRVWNWVAGGTALFAACAVPTFDDSEPKHDGGAATGGNTGGSAGDEGGSGGRGGTAGSGGDAGSGGNGGSGTGGMGGAGAGGSGGSAGEGGLGGGGGGPVCGDGMLEDPEACDDGNTDDGDYCSGDCDSVTGRCGDATTQTNEECDDGNADSGDECNPDCTFVWWDRDWKRRVRLRFDNSKQDEDLVDFTVAVLLDGSRIDYAWTRDEGEDLRFVDADGETILSHEVEVWNESDTSTVWVKIPTIPRSSKAGFVWLYSGNSSAPSVADPTGTWDAEYLGVWHMNDAVSSAPGGWLCTAAAGNAMGKLGGGQYYDGATSSACGRGATHYARFTVEAWARPESLGGVQPIVTKGAGEFTSDLDTTGHGRFWVVVDDVARTAISVTTAEANSWSYVVGTFDGTYVEQYFDGSFEGSALATGNTRNDEGYAIGANGDVPSLWFTGALDEVRLSGVVRSDNFIAAQFLSMSDQFITYSLADEIE